MKKALLILGWLVVVLPCAAEIIIVDDGGYGDFDNIQAAIDYSTNGDLIYVLPGTYTGPGNRDIDFMGKAVTVTGVDPEDPYIVAATVIDCEHASRGFYFHTAEQANSVLAGLTITNGYADYGAKTPDDAMPAIDRSGLESHGRIEIAASRENQDVQQNTSRSLRPGKRGRPRVPQPQA